MLVEVVLFCSEPGKVSLNDIGWRPSVFLETKFVKRPAVSDESRCRFVPNGVENQRASIEDAKRRFRLPG